MDLETKAVRVELWMFSVTDIAPDVAFDLLTSNERNRALRILSATRQTRFIAAHAGLRLILADSLNVPPVDVVVAEQPLGKPVVLADKAVHFSHSYSGDRVLVGCSAVEIGVDLELLQDFNWQEVSDQMLHPEERAWLQNNASGLDAFYKIWTLKEAYLKGLGTGLAKDLDSFALLPGQACRINEPNKSKTWCVANIAMREDCVAAIAVAAEAFEVRYRCFGELLPKR